MATDEKATKAALRQVKQRAVKLRKAKTQSRVVRSEVDEAILAARQAGATYREIATSADVSTAWVQSSLERSGHQTTPR
jgi:hypothetical protein